MPSQTTPNPSITAAAVLAMIRNLPRAPPALSFRVVPSWITHQEKHWVFLRPGRCPPRDRRKGTRRQWGRANPRGLRLRWVTVYDEPDHAIRIADGTVFCTARQYAAITAAARIASPASPAAASDKDPGNPANPVSVTARERAG